VVSADELTLRVIRGATGISERRIREILEIAREVELGKHIHNIRHRLGNIAMARVDLLDSGCTVFRPAIWSQP
jgi:hypothetical protein